MFQDIDDLVHLAVTEVFGTMLNMTLSRGAMADGDHRNGKPHVAGSVGFIGKLAGVVYIHVPEPFARQITAQLLGLTEAEIQGHEMVNDAMGEMANMVVGHLKSRFSDRGSPCVLTIPSVVRGCNFCIEAVSSTEGRLYAYDCDQRRIIVELLFKTNSSH